ncbi:MAG: class I SAM-dependent RNA methyltransferase [Anaerolineae bacterium]|nr:class I SAM-dependent RNA methyltransferase [Anaerolineae bacterium]
MPVGDAFELELQAMSHLGQALGRHEGKVVFVGGAIPGEVVRARVVEDQKRWARAELDDVVVPSPHRVAPPCPYYGECGGCHWQHIDAAAQLAYKRGIVVDQLARLGNRQAPVQPTLGMDTEPWFYRNHVQFAVDAEGALGFQAARSHRIVAIERCLLLHPLLDELHAVLDLDWPDLRRVSLRAGIHTGEQMVILETEGDDVPELEIDVPVSCVLRRADGADVPLIGSDVYHEALRGRRFQVSASSFFQVNTRQAEAMLDVVAGYLDPHPTETLLDVYCGVGAIGLSLVDRIGRLIAVEEHSAAVRDARANARAHGAATVIEGRAEDVLPGLEEQVDSAVIDPPRQGCKPEVLRALLRLAPQRIVYVSCDPGTMARDVVALCGAGYRLSELQPIDMFPQSYHIETVSLLERAPGA